MADCTRVGDTVTEDRRPTAAALPGFKPSVPVVFCGLFPVDAADFESLRDSLASCASTTPASHYEMETSAALGFGFRCGFLGLLHLEIIQERLEREFNLDLITTAPSVVYKIHQVDGTLMEMHNPADMPDVMKIEHIEEPWIEGDHPGARRVPGRDPEAVRGPARHPATDLTYAGNRAMVVYKLPLNEVVFDFYDRLKSVSSGYASFDYQPGRVPGRRPGEARHILVNADPVDALSCIVHRSQAEARGRALCVKLKDLIPRQLFKIAVQAAIGAKVIARETISALRKDVTAKCYGGDISRKRKLLDKQKEGKKRMRQYGNVDIPQSAFIAALKMHDN